MLQFLVTLIAVALSTWFYARAVRGIDRYEKEPARYLVAAFLWGAVPAVVLGIIVELILGLPITALLGEESLAGQLASTGVIAPVVEETLKAGAVAIIYMWRRREFDGWVDGLVYGATAGFGFAFVENIFYMISAETWGEWVAMLLLRIVIFGLMHGFWTSLTGVGFGIARHSASRARKAAAIVIGLCAAILSHMVHNSALVLAEQSAGGTLPLAFLNYGVLVVLLAGLRLLAARNDRAMLQTYLRDEVPEILSPDAYTLLSSTRSHALAGLRLAPRQQRAFIQAAAELAQKKRQLIRMGDEPGQRAEIERLRAHLAAFGR